MTAIENEQTSVLRRKSGAAPPVDPALAEAERLERRLGTAVVRAADDDCGLSLRVKAVRLSDAEIDKAAVEVPTSSVVLTLCRDGGPVGCAVIDSDLCAALIECQTSGRLKPKPADERAATATDARLIGPFIAGVLREIVATVPDFDAAAKEAEIGERLAEARKLTQIFAEAHLSDLIVEVEFAEGARVGAVRLFLPARAAACVAPQSTKATDWTAELERAVMVARAKVRAVLHRAPYTLAQLENLAVGDLMPLSGCTLADVRIETGDGRVVATGRLGQSSGMRAVRIEPRPVRTMTEGVTAAAPAPPAAEHMPLKEVASA